MCGVQVKKLVHTASTVIGISKKDIDIEYDTTKETLIWGQWCSCKKAQSILGWSAETSLEEGLKIVYNDLTKRI